MPYSVQSAPVKDTLTMTLVFIDAVGFKSQRPASQSVSEPEVSDQMAGVLLGRGGVAQEELTGCAHHQS